MNSHLSPPPTPTPSAPPMPPPPLSSLSAAPITPWRLLKISLCALLSQSTALVALAFLVNATAQASLLSILPFMVFLLVIGVQYPKPSWRLWYLCMAYIALVGTSPRQLRVERPCWACVRL
jgi:hypothetical protein